MVTSTINHGVFLNVVPFRRKKFKLVIAHAQNGISKFKKEERYFFDNIFATDTVFKQAQSALQYLSRLNLHFSISIFAICFCEKYNVI